MKTTKKYSHLPDEKLLDGVNEAFSKIKSYKEAGDIRLHIEDFMELLDEAGDRMGLAIFTKPLSEFSYEFIRCDHYDAMQIVMNIDRLLIKIQEIPKFAEELRHLIKEWPPEEIKEKINEENKEAVTRIGEIKEMASSLEDIYREIYQAPSP